MAKLGIRRFKQLLVDENLAAKDLLVLYSIIVQARDDPYEISYEYKKGVITDVIEDYLQNLDKNNEECFELLKNCDKYNYKFISEKIDFHLFTDDDLITLIVDSSIDEVKSAAVQNIKLQGSNLQLVKLGNRIQNDNLWKRINQKLDLTNCTNHAMKRIALLSRHDHIRSKVQRNLKLDNLNIQELIEVGSGSSIAGRSVTFWELVTKHYLNRQPTTDQLIEFGMAAGNWTVWEYILKYKQLKNVLPSELIIKLARQFNHHRWEWERFVELIDLSLLTADELLQIGCTARQWKVWEAILPHMNIADLTEDQLVRLSDHDSGHRTWSYLWKLFNDNESLKRLPGLAKKSKTNTFWKMYLLKTTT